MITMEKKQSETTQTGSAPAGGQPADTVKTIQDVVRPMIAEYQAAIMSQIKDTVGQMGKILPDIIKQETNKAIDERLAKMNPQVTPAAPAQPAVQIPNGPGVAQAGQGQQPNPLVAMLLQQGLQRLVGGGLGGGSVPGMEGIDAMGHMAEAMGKMFGSMLTPVMNIYNQGQQNALAQIATLQRNPDAVAKIAGTPLGQ